MMRGIGVWTALVAVGGLWAISVAGESPPKAGADSAIASLKGRITILERRVRALEEWRAVQEKLWPKPPDAEAVTDEPGFSETELLAWKWARKMAWARLRAEWQPPKNAPDPKPFLNPEKPGEAYITRDKPGRYRLRFVGGTRAGTQETKGYPITVSVVDYGDRLVLNCSCWGHTGGRNRTKIVHYARKR